MAASTKAIITLEARREDSGGYPFTFESLDDPDWWLRFPETVRHDVTREEAEHHIREIMDRENAIRQFIAQSAGLFEGSRFDRVGVVFLATDAPDAVTTYVQKDNSFAIGLDHSMTVLFSVVFSALLDAKIRCDENLTWVMALHDFVLKIFARQSSSAIDQRILERRYAPSIEAYAKEAAAMAERFLVAHELGHIYLGHLHQRRMLLVSLPANADREAELAKFDQNAEFEADEWGARLLRQAAGTDLLSLALASCVPQIYFGIFSMARLLYVPRDVLGKVLRDSHPDPWERTNRLVKCAASDEKKPSASADYNEKLQLLAGLFSAIAFERYDPVFLGAAEVFRRRLAEVPPWPEDIAKRLPFSERLERFSGYFENSAFIRRALLEISAVYYAASAAALALRADYPSFLLLLSVTGLVLGTSCFKIAAYSTRQRWSAASYGESFGLLSRGGVYIAQTAFLLKISAFAFFIVALVFGSLFLLRPS
jgi:hypothetical protein